ncbi:MAG: hypothetical protein LW707_00410 [Sphingobacteriales bacterium]|jgi:hypothetical protein|nr:hypothetical protein [Sphingobacteriales bacterium]
MKNRTHRFSLVVIACVLLTTTAGAQVLMIKRGDVRLTGVYGITRYDHVLDMDGQRQQIHSIRHSTFDLKADIGLHKRWNLLIRTPFVFNKLFGDAGFLPAWRRDTLQVGSDIQVNKLGDVEAGLRFGFLEREHVEAAFSLTHGLGTGFRAEYPYLNTGYGDYNSRIQFDACYQSDPRWYAQVNMAFNNHASGFSDEFHAMALVHAEVSKSIRAELYWRGMYNFENGRLDQKAFYSGLYQNNAAYMMIGGDGFWETSKGFGIQAGLQWPIRGQFIVASPMIRVGITALLSEKPEEKARPLDEKLMK